MKDRNITHPRGKIIIEYSTDYKQNYKRKKSKTRWQDRLSFPEGRVCIIKYRKMERQAFMECKYIFVLVEVIPK